MVRDESHALQLAEELAQLRALAGNRQWQVFQAKLQEAEKTHTKGLAARDMTAEKRAEHLEAYHLAVELNGWWQARVEAITEALEDWGRSQQEVDGRVLGALDGSLSE